MTVQIPSGRTPCPIESGVWRLVAQALFKSKQSFMRELVSNSIDAIEKRIANGDSDVIKRVKIKYTENDLIEEDWGTGVLDFKEFVRISVPSYKKVKRGKKDIGYFGVGKTSFILQSLIELVCFESVNYDNGMKFDLRPDEDDKLTYSDPPTYHDRNAVMDHQGLRVIIKNIKKHMPLPDLAKYLGEIFAPKIKIEGYEIILEDVEGEQIIVQAPDGFRLPDKDPLFTLDDGTVVFGSIRKARHISGKIKGYRRGVLISDPLEFAFKIDEESYVLLDTKAPPIETLTAGRDSWQTDTTHYEDIINKTTKYLKEHGFEQVDKTVAITRRGMNAFDKEMKQQFLNYIRHNPDDTPPPFLDKVLQEQEAGTEKNKKKELTDKRKDRKDKKGKKVTSETEKTGRKNKKHKHWREIDQEALNSADAGIGSEIAFMPAPKGSNPPQQYDPNRRLFVINTIRPAGLQIINEQYRSTHFSRATRDIFSMSVVDCFDGNHQLSPREYNRKLYDMLDDNITGAKN